MEVELKAPKGKFRVVARDMLSHKYCFVGDYDSKPKACQIAEQGNNDRIRFVDDVYFVYDDEGRLIQAKSHGNDRVSESAEPSSFLS